MSPTLAAEHGVVCSIPGERFGYFGWPSITRTAGDRLVVVASGLRAQHVCPYGKTVLCYSDDNGTTWSDPAVINNSPIDDRDAGVVCPDDHSLLVSWFTSDTRQYADSEWIPAAERNEWKAVFATWTDELMATHLGSWTMLSEDRGASWQTPQRAPVSAPHGPVRLRDGRLLYLGKVRAEASAGHILAVTSSDKGRSWDALGEVPLIEGVRWTNCTEPHAVELDDGRLIGAIRLQGRSEHDLEEAGLIHFSLLLTTSDDGGCTWSPPRPLGFHGSPPHLLRHSSGTLLISYGYRLAPYGQRVAISTDHGTSWSHDWILRDDGPDWDLGYPATTELGDGRLLSVYYQKIPGQNVCSLLCSRWELPS